MRKLISKLMLAAIVSGLLGALVIPAAAGWAGNNTCNTTSGICVSLDDNNGVPRAVTCCSDNTYVGDKYFNTTTNIDNTVSSVRNAFAGNDVTFHVNTNGGGDSFCQDSGTQDNDLGWFGSDFDDKLSSHNKSAGDGVC